MSFSCTFFFCSCSFLFFSLFFLILLNFSPQFCLCLSCSFILAFFFLFFIVIFVVSIILFYSFMLLVLIVLLRLLLLLLLVIRPFPFLIRHYLLLFLLRLCCYHMIPSIGQHPGSVALGDRRQKTITIVTKSEQSRPKHFDR